MESVSETIEMSSILEKLSDHLDFLAGRVFDVEEELGSLLVGSNSGESVSITKIQSLDFTRQSLEDCALLVQVIRKHTAGESIQISSDVFASSDLKLNSTKNIVGPCKQSTPIDYSGQIDMF